MEDGSVGIRSRGEGRSDLGILERRFFEIFEEGVEGEKGRLKAGTRPAAFPPKAGQRPAALGRPCFQGRRPLAGLDLEGPKAGPRPAVLIYFIKKKKKKRRERKRMKGGMREGKRGRLRDIVELK